MGSVLTMAGPINIILADDHEIIRKGVRSYLETLPDFVVVGEATSGEEILALVSELLPDIILLEIMMSDMNGIETIRRLKQISPRTKVVILTACSEDTYIFPAMEAGAVSYNLKNLKMDRLADELRYAHHSELRLHPRVAVLMLEKIHDEKSRESFHFIELTNRELDMLRLIANGLTNSQVAETLVVSDSRVKDYVSNILSKLYMAGCLQAAVAQAEQRRISSDS